MFGHAGNPARATQKAQTMEFILIACIGTILGYLSSLSQRQRDKRQQQRDDRIIAAINSLKPREAARSFADDGPRGYWLGEAASETPSPRIDFTRNTFAFAAAAVVMLIALAMIAFATRDGVKFFFVKRGDIVRRKADPIHTGRVERVDVTRGLVNVRWLGGPRGTLEFLIPATPTLNRPRLGDGVVWHHPQNRSPPHPRRNGLQRTRDPLRRLQAHAPKVTDVRAFYRK